MNKAKALRLYGHKSKNIEDYLHLYIGCRYLHPPMVNIRKLRGVDVDWYNKFQVEIKPLLRPLSDMTEEERFFMGIGKNTKNKSLSLILECLKPSEFVYLLSKHFDLFGLIEVGLALDSTKINQDANKQ